MKKKGSWLSGRVLPVRYLPADIVSRGYGLFLDPPIAPESIPVVQSRMVNGPVADWDIAVFEYLRIVLVSKNGTKDIEVTRAFERLLRFSETNLWRMTKRFRELWRSDFALAHANILDIFVRMHIITRDARFLNAALKMRRPKGMRILAQCQMIGGRNAVPIRLCWQNVDARVSATDMCELV